MMSATAVGLSIEGDDSCCEPPRLDFLPGRRSIGDT